MAELRQELASLEAESGEKSRRFGDDWPGMQTLRSKIDHAKSRLDEEVAGIANQVRSAAKSEFIRAKAELENLDDLLVAQENAAQQLKRESFEYANLEGDVEKKRETLDALITRRNEMSLATRLQDLKATSSNIRLLNEAKPPSQPFKPNTRFNLLVGLVLGLGAGVGLAVVLDRLDNTVSSAEELQRASNWSLLAMIPHYSSGAGGTPPFKRLMRRTADETETTVDLVTHRDGLGGVAEAYRDLRTALLLSSAGHAPRSIVLTSALPGEGKSATAINLSVVLAQTGARVLLIDADLRKPRLHRAFGIENPAGVSSYLSGMEAEPAKLVVSTEIDGLHVLTSGPVPPNPSELLNSAQFRQMTADLLDAGYDHLVFDSPPVLSVSDPVIVATSMDCCILVVRADSTPRPSVRLAVERLEPAAAGTTGLVLNDLEASRWKRGYYGSSYYGEQPEKLRTRTSSTEKLARPGGGRA
jgi:capsular exopolysaccharide synthesis family protein